MKGCWIERSKSKDLMKSSTRELLETIEAQSPAQEEGLAWLGRKNESCAKVR